MSYLKAFTKQMEQFINELSEMFPQDKHIAMGKSTLFIVKKANPRKLLEFFKFYFYKYEDKIMSKDESFFLERNFDDQLSDYVKSLNAITNLKQYWKNLTEKTKNTIWLYLIVLLKLSKKA
tara:strand:+ start:141 stop:503 length:363 start_codon:yes stop_codon:yes gene_type:complete